MQINSVNVQLLFSDLISTTILQQLDITQPFSFTSAEAGNFAIYTSKTNCRNILILQKFHFKYSVKPPFNKHPSCKKDYRFNAVFNCLKQFFMSFKMHLFCWLKENCLTFSGLHFLTMSIL